MGRSPFERFSLDARNAVPERAVPNQDKKHSKISFSAHVRWGEPGFPVTRLRDTTACAPFSEERRMKLAEATNLDRKSGEHGAPVWSLRGGGQAKSSRFPTGLIGTSLNFTLSASRPRCFRSACLGTSTRRGSYCGYASADQFADKLNGQRFVVGQMKAALGARVRL
jgi:hypothetical protein